MKEQWFRAGIWVVLTLNLMGCGALGFDEFTVNTEVCQKVHGCIREEALNANNVNFGASGYSPRCIVVAEGTEVQWLGETTSTTFGDFPLKGGVKPDEDPESPMNIDPPGEAEISAGYVLKGACVFPFFSMEGGEEMMGAVFIDGY